MPLYPYLGTSVLGSVGRVLAAAAASFWKRGSWDVFVASQWYHFFCYAKVGKLQTKLKVMPGMSLGAIEVLNSEGFLQKPR